MGQADWAELDSGLDIADLNRGVTAGIDRPNGGGQYVYGFNCLDGTITGASGLYVNLTGFTPTGSGLAVPDGGASARCAVKRVTSPNNLGFSPFVFACCQGGPPSVNDNAYMLGLSNADPYEIMIAKGPIISGLNGDDSNITILERSSAQYSMGDGLWHHVRLDAIVQPNGDVLLRGYENDLALHAIGTTPSWAEITGFTPGGFIDDRLHINSGSAPLWGGWVGFAFQVSQTLNARGAFDGFEAYRVL
jgi:hypothetical protein